MSLRALKPAPEAPPLKVPAQTLLHHLETSLCNLDQLLVTLDCSPQDLLNTLNDPGTADLVRLRVQLAAIQMRLLAARYAPFAINNLVHLASTSDKPEVCRRCSMTVLHVAGIPTETKPLPVDPVTPPTPDAPPDAPAAGPSKTLPDLPDSPEEQESVMHALMNILALKRQENIDLNLIPETHYPRFVELLRAFFHSCDIPLAPAQKAADAPTESAPGQTPPATS